MLGAPLGGKVRFTLTGYCELRVRGGQSLLAQLVRRFSLAGLLLVSSCGVQGSYVWARDVPVVPQPPPEAVLLRVGDTVNVVVKNQTELSSESKVRADGTVVLPVVGQVRLVGMTLGDAATLVRQRLTTLVVNPEVTVSLISLGPIDITVIGEVKTPGAYEFDPRDGLLTVLARCGGLTEFAKKDRVFVVRQRPEPLRVRFDFRTLSAGDSTNSFRLQDGDAIVVE